MAPECYFPMGGIAQYIEKFAIKFDNKQMSETDYRLILTNVLKILNDESSGSCEPMELTIDGVHKSPKPYCEWPTNYRSTMCWRHLSPGFQSAFAALCRSPRLKKLNILGVSRLPITLFDGTSIKDLHMSFCSSFEPRSLVGPRLRPAALEYFETDSTFAEENIDPIYAETLLLSNVKEMRFPYTFFGVGSTVRHGIETLISLSGRKLKRLYLAHRPSEHILKNYASPIQKQ
ncbi:hypothetical protein GALMADRAFT_456585 [Galerina marginata CBS 339.88]|uniref:Uncharacterized protein n=1 Tax=Galerina marginata (strain CBS 339.88) TaxID=685588 RepID=A0A067SYJ1_GALM3|nr:hypothetical protein GALMADRAFT_456585 [Galerina marginata CBS 339.88]